MEQTYSIEIIQPSDLENLSTQDNVIELTDVGIIGLDSLCRLCANRSDHLIPIYEGEGLDYQLEVKINRHFPFTVERTDTLPTHCCYQCASTLLTWHELIETSIEADRRLKALEFDTVVQFNHKLENLEDTAQQEVISEETTEIYEEAQETENISDISTNDQQRSHAAVLVSFSSYHNAQKALLFNQTTDDQTTQALTPEERLKFEENQQQSSVEDGIETLPLSERVRQKLYRCDTCNETFKTIRHLKNHLTVTLHKARVLSPTIARSSSVERQRFYCDICDYGFSEQNLMLQHRDQTHQDSNETEGDPLSNDNTETPVHEEVHEQTKAIYENGESQLIDIKTSQHQDTLALAVSIIKTELNEVEKTQKPVGKLFCFMCKSPFEIKVDLKRHIRIRHPETINSKVIKRRKKSEITPNFYCDVCLNGFTRKYDMQKHRKQSHLDIPEKENVKKSKSQRNSELLARCKIEYEGRPHYKCEHCNRIIHLSYNFLRHQTIHTGVRAFFCHLCGKSFRLSSGLNRHIKELHYGVKNYPCDMCGRCFASKNTRDDHMNIHTGARPFVCDQCGKCFKQKASLHVHKIFHTNEKPYICGTCGKQFRRATELKVHGWLHTGHKPHACTTCGSTFRLAQDLKRHQKTHSKDFQVACEECGACFGQARYLKSHLKTHRKKEAAALSTSNNVEAVDSIGVENEAEVSETKVLINNENISILPDMEAPPEYIVNS